MQIAIIADLHDNLNNWQKILNILLQNKIEYLIICGDITSTNTLNKIADDFRGTIHVVFGNMDQYPEQMELLGQKYEHLKIYGHFGRFKIDQKIFIISHYQEEVEVKAESEKADVLCCGHSHKQIYETNENYILINPGTAGGAFAKASFAMYDIENNSNKFIEI